MKYTRKSLALVKLINVINYTLFLYVANASLELLCLTRTCNSRILLSDWCLSFIL